jgi:hypothetical protein
MTNEVSEEEVFAKIDELVRLGLAEVNPEDIDKPRGLQRMRLTPLGLEMRPDVEALVRDLKTD